MRTEEGAEEPDRPNAGRLAERDDDPETSLEEGEPDGEIPTLPDVVGRLAEGVRSREIIGVLVFDATPLETWEHEHGSEAFDNLLERFATVTRETCGSTIRQRDAVCRNAPGGGSILVFLSRPRSDAPGSQVLDFEKVAERTKEYTVGALANGDGAIRDALERIQIGTSLIVGKETVDARRQIYRAIRRARQDLRARRDRRTARLQQVVGSVIAQRDIETRYQPIVELNDREPIGYEALSRVGESKADELDDPLFKAADEVELEAELDQICRSLSVDRRPELAGDGHLFVNCLPTAFYDPTEQLEALLDQWLDQEGLSAEQLVFEINEDISQGEADRILPTIRRLRRRGFQFALDDVGTGKTNLRLLADLEPTFIKMDISLTSGIGASVRKQALASYLLDLADKSDAELVAEGVESQRDLETVIELGVDYAQGYLIGRPGEHGEFI